jgi:curved DNA-binding protein CbpA
MSNYYEILGLKQSATQEEIRKSYRRLATQYHPDKNVGKSQEKKDEAAQKFDEISSAYFVLSNDELKSDYDKILKFVKEKEDLEYNISLYSFAGDKWIEDSVMLRIVMKYFGIEDNENTIFFAGDLDNSFMTNNLKQINNYFS